MLSYPVDAVIITIDLYRIFMLVSEYQLERLAWHP